MTGAGKGRQGEKERGDKLCRNGRVSSRRLNDARAVLRHSPELAEAVRDGV
jgi:hypothetical protein